MTPALASAAARRPEAAALPLPPLGPWNPGIESFIPRHLLPLATHFRPENVFTSVDQVAERRDLTGLAPAELTVFRPERLALHELLIRVTGDFSVSDGVRYADLGINFRAMVGTILERYLAPHSDELVATYDEARRQVASAVAAELKGGDGGDSDLDRAEAWEAAALADAMADHEGPRAAAQLALAKVVRALFARHGSVWGDRELIGRLATDLACNRYGSDEIGRRIEPWLDQAVRAEGYRRLPAQPRPLVLNTKGPSASGKSTLRPLQKTLAGRIGVSWDEFALISPDIWRKQLLDYASLGADYRYAAPLTGEELAIIDLKLDRYMERKAAAGGTSHMLIDRFRFGSFAADSARSGKLLSRFGAAVYFFFMLTPPEALVERAWQRGLEVGRYKALDDLLAHAVEAYAGMPRLFLAWAEQTEKPVHYEFLDNSVALGELPRTAAFGWNRRMFILDVPRLLELGRFRRINIEATAPEELYPEGDVATEADADFLVDCVRRLDEVSFAERTSGRLYLQLKRGAVAWTDETALECALADPATRRGILAAVPNLGARSRSAAATSAPRTLRELLPAERLSTLGDWGGHEVHEEAT